jgi:hypothetical protein
MTETTDRLALPLLDPSQAQKEIYHNEALVRLDLLTQATAQDIAGNIPPEDPGPGQCWIIGSAPQGAWLGHPQEIAGWTEGGWRFVTPLEGMQLWLDPTRGLARYTQGGWRTGETHGRVLVDGKQIVGPRVAAIAEPEGGTVVDAPARAAITAVLVALREHGLIETFGL